MPCRVSRASAPRCAGSSAPIGTAGVDQRGHTAGGQGATTAELRTGRGATRVEMRLFGVMTPDEIFIGGRRDLPRLEARASSGGRSPVAHVGLSVQRRRPGGARVHGSRNDARSPATWCTRRARARAQRSPVPDTSLQGHLVTGARGEGRVRPQHPRCQTPRYRCSTAAPPVPDTSLRTPRYASLPTPRYRVTGPRHPA